MSENWHSPSFSVLLPVVSQHFLSVPPVYSEGMSTNMWSMWLRQKRNKNNNFAWVVLDPIQKQCNLKKTKLINNFTGWSSSISEFERLAGYSRVKMMNKPLVTVIPLTSLLLGKPAAAITVLKQQQRANLQSKLFLTTSQDIRLQFDNKIFS